MASHQEKDPAGLTKAIKVLASLCRDGEPKTSQQVHQALNDAGLSRKYLSQARKRCGVTTHRTSDNKMIYQLASHLAAANNPIAARSSELLQEKSSLELETVKAKLEDQVPGYDPVVALAQIGQDMTVPLAVRLEIHQTLLKYLVPQVKAAEITTADQPIALKFRWGHENDDKGPDKIPQGYKKKQMPPEESDKVH